jgi:hypothetical protein
MGDSVLSVSAAIHPNVHSPEDVFRLYRGRRAGIVQALTEGLSLSRSFEWIWCGFFSRALIDGCVCLPVSWFADVDEFYEKCDPGEFSQSLPMLISREIVIWVRTARSRVFIHVCCRFPDVI